MDRLARVSTSAGPSPRLGSLGRERVLALLTVITLATILISPGVAFAHTVLPGLSCDEVQAASGDPATQAGIVKDVAVRLHARVVKVSVSWPALEPSRGVFDDTYLDTLSTSIGLLRASGVKVVCTVCGTPPWASDSTLWDAPPFGLPEGYDPRYAMREDALADFGAAAQQLATRFSGRVFAWECWNEPNLWPYLYPQRTSSDAQFAAHLYVKMLRAFRMGIRAGDPRAKVIAGATGPVGLNDRARTSPQSFARAVRRAGGAAWFDVYSHHPYTIGGSVDPRPAGKPNDTSTTVTLGNIRTLLRIFPHKSFYLTEYGYNTAFSAVFAGLSVSPRTQARYLRQAYAIAGRHRQIRMLIWFKWRDSRAQGAAASAGVYSGLRTLRGTRKPAWYAFSRL